MSIDRLHILQAGSKRGTIEPTTKYYRFSLARQSYRERMRRTALLSYRCNRFPRNKGKLHRFFILLLNVEFSLKKWRRRPKLSFASKLETATTGYEYSNT